MPREVTLEQMLSARERRAARQRELLAEHPVPLISFTMNIPGPVKDAPLIRRAFRTGRRALEEQLALAGLPVLHWEETLSVTGCEAFCSVEGEALGVKKLCVAIEEAAPLGRLLDLDVLTPQGEKLDREAVGGGSRNCIVCGAPGRDCASRRLHSPQELQAATLHILSKHFARSDGERVAQLATQALLREAQTTPKPGLVDRRNNGSHADMDLALLEKSSRALTPYWAQFFRLGRKTAPAAPEEVFPQLQALGLEAEQAMLASTGGVNTHKGAIFLLGILCGAIGRLWSPEEPCRDPVLLGRACTLLSTSAMERHWDTLRSEPGLVRTAGERIYLQYGFTGARGEAALGLPGAVHVALPFYKAALGAGLDSNHAGAVALLHLIARGTDTNMIRRGGYTTAQLATREVVRLLREDPFPSREEIIRLDDRFIAQNLSPGGCADLLAVTYLLHSWAGEI